MYLLAVMGIVTHILLYCILKTHEETIPKNDQATHAIRDAEIHVSEPSVEVIKISFKLYLSNCKFYVSSALAIY